MAKSDDGRRPGLGAPHAEAEELAQTALPNQESRSAAGAASPGGEDSSLFATMDSQRGPAAPAPAELSASILDTSGVGGAQPDEDAAESALHGALFESAAESSGTVKAAASIFPVAEWDRYEFLSLLGQGGMGAVYKARDRRIRRLVALKFIRGGDERLTQRFLQEARAQARVDHPGICKVLEVGEVEGKCYIAMQFIDGMSLQQARTRIEMMEKAEIIKEAAEALHAAHEIGVIHRDIKPANIMIEKGVDGRYHPVIMDFGLARDTNESAGMTESGTVMGTAAFMSPEQARGDVRLLDRRTDVYSLGATLYDVLVNRPPFVADSMADTLLKVMLDEPVSPRRLRADVPEALETITLKCLNKEPQQRYASALDLAADLDRFLSKRRIIAKRLGFLYRLRWRAKNNKPAAVAGLALVLSLFVLAGYGVRTRIQNIRKEQQAARQAELAQKLGQEIKDMEWLLRSARQLPLHDLRREKEIVRRRMSELQGEFQSYGELGQGLAHYALGRGHMALHEYPQALAELQQAVAKGNTSADVQYALGFVLGKHYERAMYEARLAGGGDWAQKQLKEIEPKYLTPAIESLSRGRAMSTAKKDGEYLEALIAYYQRDYAGALRHAQAALRAAPWLYEALKLAGDIRFEQALTARDTGKYEVAEKEFAASVKSLDQAADAARSDSEVYEALAESWVRQIEMAVTRGQATESAYAAAVAAADRAVSAEPEAAGGHLKKSFAAMLTMALVSGGKGSESRVQSCLAETDIILKHDPNHPYARDVAADCYLFAADLAQSSGKDPEPLLRKPMELLRPALEQNPRFLWGINDLATAYASLGIYLQSKSDPQTRSTFENALIYAKKAMSLDGSYLIPIQNSLFIWARLLATASTASDLEQMLRNADDLYSKCLSINDKYQQCHINYLMVYARAAQRLTEAELDPGAQLRRAMQTQKRIAALGGAFLDAEQFGALTHYVAALDGLHKAGDAAGALTEMEAALQRCFALADKDALCRTLAAQADWIRVSQQATGKRQAAVLDSAQRKAELATTSPEKLPDSFRALAETHLRRAGLAGTSPAEQAEKLALGLAATEQALKLNAAHVPSLITQGDLYVGQARLQRDPARRRTAGRQAAESYTRARQIDAFLSASLDARLAEARRLSAEQ